MMKCPTDFHGFKLLRVIGSGCYSDAYLAESPVKSGLPRLVCIKVATDKQDIHPLLYTDKSARGELVYQREILKPLMHPFVVKYFEDALPDVANAIVLEAGIVDLKRLQTSLDTTTNHFRENQFHPIVVKYFAAQMFLAVAYLHSRGVLWSDPKQSNLLLMHDFTLRIIDIGGATNAMSHRKFIDFCLTAATINNMSTTSDEAFDNLQEDAFPQCLERFQSELSPSLYDLLRSLTRQIPFSDLLSHTYWSETINGDPRTKLELLNLKGQEVERLKDIRRAAWDALPEKTRTWRTDARLDIVQ